ncbi:hypothetical protein Ga0074812_106292 [Parafrankia irregularis]|uniref:Histidine kinase n=1 Tax=Parafrankia irregularis TaxID=795642 RepID=A0A0S4QK69_9ACTN|nr:MULTISPECIES: hypothetical protein [Parafrankia]MBE3202270.1 hypothetical protein [Parafrankia sp. CH37]CUU56037.1 hypothetical protein Ga0074812_106292 [Parafrankia irregularis]
MTDVRRGPAGSSPAPPAVFAPAEVLARQVAPMPGEARLRQRVMPLLENLGTAGEGCYAALWVVVTPGEATQEATSEGGPASWAVLGWARSPSWPPAGLAPMAVRAGAAEHLAELRSRPGVRLLAPIPGPGRGDSGSSISGRSDGGGEGRTPAAALVIGGMPGRAMVVPPADLIDQTRDCLALVLRVHELTLAADEQAAGARRCEEELARVEADLAAVRDAERNRLSGSLLIGVSRRLGEVTDRWQACVAAVRDEPARAGDELRELRSAVDDLLEDFRTVVRAVHPVLLRRAGTAVALTELASRLPRQVRIGGDPGRRVGWEVESGVYHACAAALNLLGEAGTGPLSMRFVRGDGRFGVRVDDPSPGAVARARDSLRDDARRLSALGGALHCTVAADGSGRIDLWLPERLDGRLPGAQKGTTPQIRVPASGVDVTDSVPPTEASLSRGPRSHTAPESSIPGPSSSTVKASPW